MRTRSHIIHNYLAPGHFNYLRHDNLPNPGSCSNPVIENVDYTSPAFTSTAFPDSSLGTITDEQPMHQSEGYCRHDVQNTEFYDFGPTPLVGNVIAGIPLCCHEYNITGQYLQYVYARTRTHHLYPDVTISPDRDWGEWSYEAVRTMMPTFSRGNQFLNDILELHQIKGLLTPIRRKASAIGNVSNATLWYNFGVLPMIQTIEGVVDLMRTVRLKIADIRRRAKRLQTRHYARPLDLVSDLPDGWFIDDVGNDYKTVLMENEGEYRETELRVLTRWQRTPQYHATMKFRYDVSLLSDIELELRAWGEAMGILNPLSVVWNAIPFSFVLDWFTNIGDWIDGLLREPAIPIVIEDFSHSVKYSYTTEMQILWWRKSFNSLIAKGTVSHYERRRDIPSSRTELQLKVPRISAYYLGAALAGQAYANRPKPPRIRKQLRYLRFKAGTIVS